MPSRTAASIPATISGELPSSPNSSRRDRQHAVVADVRPRRDPGDLHLAGRPGRARAVVAGGDPGDVRAVLRLLRVERQLRVAPVRARRRERARDDHLGRRVGRVALRVAGGHREAGRREERMRLVDAVVDHADLDPVARGRERRAPDLRRADHLRAAVERAVVADALLHLAHAGQRGDPGGRVGRARRPRARSARAGSASGCARPERPRGCARRPWPARARSRLGRAAARRAACRPAARRARPEAPPATGGLDAADPASGSASAATARARRPLFTPKPPLHCPSARMWRNW